MSFFLFRNAVKVLNKSFVCWPLPHFISPCPVWLSPAPFRPGTLSFHSVLRSETPLVSFSTCLGSHFGLNGQMWRHAARQRCMLGLLCHLGLDCERGRGRARWVLTWKQESGNMCWLMCDGKDYVLTRLTLSLCFPVSLSLHQRSYARVHFSAMWECYQSACVFWLNWIRRFS